MDALMTHSPETMPRGGHEAATQLALRYFECLPKPTLPSLSRFIQPRRMCLATSRSTDR